MVSTFTPNIGIEEPARGDDVGTWDTPVNTNMTLLDNVLANQVTIGLNNSNVVLSAAQAQSAFITFNSTLTGSVNITFPTSYKKSYVIRHVCTGSSAFTITLQTTAAGGQVVGCRPGNPFQVYNDGANLFYVNLGVDIGGYWDYAGSSVPNWVSACTIPPYINCDGSTFSATTYPQLAIILGSTTLPDSKGRVRATLDQGTTRLTGVISNTVGAAGGDQNLQAHSHTTSVSDPTHTHGVSGGTVAGNGSNIVPLNSGAAIAPVNAVGIGINAAATGIGVTVNSNGSGAGQNVQPTYRGGLTLIRAA